MWHQQLQFSQGRQWRSTMLLKQYVLSFSEAIDNEVETKGITVTALCPGATKVVSGSCCTGRKAGCSKTANFPPQRGSRIWIQSNVKGKTIAIHGLMMQLWQFCEIRTAVSCCQSHKKNAGKDKII